MKCILFLLILVLYYIIYWLEAPDLWNKATQFYWYMSLSKHLKSFFITDVFITKNTSSKNSKDCTNDLHSKKKEYNLLPKKKIKIKIQNLK